MISSRINYFKYHNLGTLSLFVQNSLTPVYLLIIFFSIEEYPQPYCGIVDGMAMACLEMSILELFGRGGEYSAETDAEIEELTDQQVLHAINSRQRC